MGLLVTPHPKPHASDKNATEGGKTARNSRAIRAPRITAMHSEMGCPLLAPSRRPSNQFKRSPKSADTVSPKGERSSRYALCYSSIFSRKGYKGVKMASDALCLSKSIYLPLEKRGSTGKKSSCSFGSFIFLIWLRS